MQLFIQLVLLILNKNKFEFQMRGFKQAILKVNMGMLINNPVTRTPYTLLWIFKTALIFSLPLIQILGVTEETLFQMIFKRRYPITIGSLIFTFVGFQCMILLIYFGLVGAQLFRLKKGTEEKTNGMTCCLKLLVVLQCVNATILDLPIKAFSIIVISSKFLNYTASPLLTTLSYITLFLDFIIQTTSQVFLKCMFPLPQVPWALPQQNQTFLNDLVIYFLSMALTIPTTFKALPYLFGVSTFIGAMAFMFVFLHYDKMQTVLQVVYESIRLSSLAILTGVYCGDRERAYKYLPLYVLLIVSLTLTKMLFIFSKQASILVTSVRIKNSTMKSIWLWSLNSKFTLSNNEDLSSLVSKYQAAQVILITHFQLCTQVSCKCKEPETLELFKVDESGEKGVLIDKIKALLLILIELGVDSKQESSANESDSTKKNTRIHMVKVHFQFMYQEKHLKSIYSCQKYHDCRKCSFGDCFQKQLLETIIVEKFNASMKQVSQQDEQDFSRYLIFESNFREYLSSINKLAQFQQDYWLGIQKREENLQSTLIQGEIIYSEYQKMRTYKDLIKDKCGDILFVEIVSWKFHSEVLNFELEADQDLECIKAIHLKQKIDRSDIETKDSEIDQKQSIVVLSCHPYSFQTIKLVNKRFCSLTGYVDDLVMKKKITIFLPQVIEQTHHKFVVDFISNFMVQKAQTNLKQLWLKQKSGTVKSINLQIIPSIVSGNEIQLVGLISENKSCHLFQEVISFDLILCILTDNYGRIFHYSENFLRIFRLGEKDLVKEMNIEELIPNIPVNNENDDDKPLILVLDILKLKQSSEGFYEKGENIGTQYNIQLKQEVHRYGENAILREYQFVLRNSENFSFMLPQVNTDQFQINTQEVIASHHTSQSHSAIDLSSLSTDSRSSNTQEQKLHQQIFEVKGKVDPEHSPYILKRFRWMLFIGLLIMVAFSSFYIAINMKVESQVIKNLSLLGGEKNLKNSLAYQTTFLMGAIYFENLPKDFDMSQVLGYLPDYGDYYRSLSISIGNLTRDFIGNYSMSQKDWDNIIPKSAVKNDIQIVSISDDGAVLIQQMDFRQAFNLFMVNQNIAAKHKLSEFGFFWDMFTYNSVSYYSQIVAQLEQPQKEFMQNIFFVFYNGGKSILDQLFTLDLFYLTSILELGDNQIRTLLIYTIMSIALTVLIVALYIPFFFQIESSYHIMMSIFYKIKKESLMKILERIKDFDVLSDEIQYIKINNAMSLLSTKARRNANQGEQDRSNLNIGLLNDCDLSRPDTTMANLTTNKHYESNNNFLTTGNNRASFSPQRLQESQKDQQLNKGLSKNKTKQVKEETHQGNNFAFHASKTTKLREEEKIEDADEQEEGVEKGPDVTNSNDMDRTVAHLIVEDVKKMKFNDEIKRRKLVIIVLGLISISLYSSYYAVTFSLQNKYNQEFSKAFSDIDIFFQNTPCLYMDFFLYYNTILFNESLTLDTANGQRLDGFSSQCSENEVKFREMTQNQNSIFSGFSSFLAELDSPNYCNFTFAQNFSSFTLCPTVMDGIFELGQTQATKIIKTQLQSHYIQYQFTPPQERTRDFLEKMFYNVDIINSMIVALGQIGYVFFNEQPKLIAEFNNQIEKRFNLILAVFFIYLSVLLVIFVVFMWVVIMKLRRRLHVLRLLIKTVPAEEILQSINLFQQINPNQF